ncbi:hypothetical protein N9241_02070, partial [bacterium]|nr:hypothetical protein [bacterium]
MKHSTRNGWRVSRILVAIQIRLLSGDKKGGYKMYPFKSIVTDEASLQKILGKPHSQVVNKTIQKLDKHCKA